MIALWNRKEIYYGFSLEQFSNIRSILSQNRIRYDVRTISRTSSKSLGSTRGFIGSFGENPNLAYEYYIYVHKDDYSKALVAINSNK
ncbi:hypothetical protein [Clostridium tertium]|uniref:DUF2007 domain-containing protein n=1 Tax=Clostridium tertium TaxID=1559 RepID=A0A6N3FVQ7_9CLOT